MHIFDDLLIYQANLSIILWMLYIFSLLISTLLKVDNVFWRNFVVDLHYSVPFEEISFGVLFWSKYCWLSKEALVDSISVHRTWYLFLGVIANFLWIVSKLDMHICFPFRIEEFCGEDSTWVFILVDVNLFFLLIQNHLQYHLPIISLFIVDLYFCIHWISVHWYWYFSSGVITKFLSVVSKQYIHNFSLRLE